MEDATTPLPSAPDAEDTDDIRGCRLERAAAILADHPLGQTTGLVPALRRLATVDPPPQDLSDWLLHRLREHRPSHHNSNAPLPVDTDGHEPVLVDGMAIKCDEFAGIHVLPTPRVHPSVWNFRKTDLELPVYGVGQCHYEGLEYLLEHHLRQTLGHESVRWFNLREEPVVFLDGIACAPRLAGRLNDNVDYLCGIEGHELDAMEARLAQDCVERARESDSQSLGVYHQTADGSNEARPVPLEALESETTLSVKHAYQRLSARSNQGMHVRYCRIPIADETAPEAKDFDQLVFALREFCRQQPSDDNTTAFVFNCQMGRGRTTTGMVSACILFRAAAKAAQQKANDHRQRRRSSVSERCRAMSTKLRNATNETKDETKSRRDDEYQSIAALLDMIDCSCSCSGRDAQNLADECIDACAHAQNLHECVAACTTSANQAEPGAPRSPEFWLGRALHYLERYACLVLLAAYALEHAAAGYSGDNFTGWIRRHWHFQRVLRHLTLERTPAPTTHEEAGVTNDGNGEPSERGPASVVAAAGGATLHRLVGDDKLLDRASRLLSDQWPKGGPPAAYHARMGGSPPTGLPCSYALVDGGGNCLGHGRLTECFESAAGNAVAVTFLVVAPSARGSGWGRTLMALLEDRARALGYHYVYLWTQTAIGFYERIGYSRCERVSLKRDCLKRLDAGAVQGLESILQKRRPPPPTNGRSTPKNPTPTETILLPPTDDNDGATADGSPASDDADTWLRKRLVERVASVAIPATDRLEDLRTALRDAGHRSRRWAYRLVDVPWEAQIGPSCGLAALRMATEYLIAGAPSSPSNTTTTPPSLLAEGRKRGYTVDGEVFDAHHLRALAEAVCGIDASLASFRGLTPEALDRRLVDGGLWILPYDSQPRTHRPVRLSGRSAHYGMVVGLAVGLSSEEASSGGGGSATEAKGSTRISLEPLGDRRPPATLPDNDDGDDDAVWVLVQHGLSPRLSVARWSEFAASNLQLTTVDDRKFRPGTAAISMDLSDRILECRGLR